jgi:resolvase, N domain protein
MMKAKDVLKILKVTRQTLTKYVKEGRIKVTVKGNGQYDYDVDDVYKLVNRDIERKTYVYARVATSNQKEDLDNQVHILKTFCFQNGYVLDGVYQDVASGISFEKRTQFFDLLDEVLAGRVKKVIVVYSDRISRIGFELFNHLFTKHGCDIIVISEVGSTDLDNEEIFEDVVSLLHCYSMKIYSKRKDKVIKELIEDDGSTTSGKTHH